MRRANANRAAAFVLFTVSLAVPARAETGEEWFGLETTASIDLFRCPDCDRDTKRLLRRPQLIVEVLATVRLAEGWQVYVRPWFRLPRPTTLANPSPPWDKQIYQAALKYERRGRIGTRFETGYIASPVGLGMLDTSPSVNPMIGVHQPYFAPMLPFDLGGGRRVSAISSSYPLGSVLTLSTDKWDARAAVLNSTPTRIYVIGGAANPRPTPALVVGAGITPTMGLRLGASIVRGQALTAAEVPPTARGGERMLNMVGIEGEYAFAYTKLSGELVRDAFSIPGISATAYAWFVQGRQILSPRWYVAGRHEGTSAPFTGGGPALAAQPTYKSAEGTFGFRMTRDIILKTSYYARQGYGRTRFDHQLGVSAVWSKRWW